MLYEQLQKDYMQARKAKETLKKDILGFVVAEIKNQAIDEQGELDDEQVIKLLKKEIKNREESIDYLEQSGNKEERAREEQKITILTAYLPEQITGDALRELVDQKIDELDITDLHQQKGKLIGTIMSEYGPKIDGTELNQLVTELATS